MHCVGVWGEAKWRQHSLKCVTRSGGFLSMVVIRKEAKRYVGSVLGGFEWPIFVGVDAFAYGKTGS